MCAGVRFKTGNCWPPPRATTWASRPPGPPTSWSLFFPPNSLADGCNSDAAPMELTLFFHRANGPWRQPNWRTAQMRYRSCLTTCEANPIWKQRPTVSLGSKSRISDAILDMIPSAEAIEALHSRARIARAVLQLLHDRRENPPSVTEMCAAGRRARAHPVLELHRGVWPASRATVVGASAQRRASCPRYPSNGASITSVAAHYGFTHFGRFAAMYFRQFGELPSVTLAKSLGFSVMPALVLGAVEITSPIQRMFAALRQNARGQIVSDISLPAAGDRRNEQSDQGASIAGGARRIYLPCDSQPWQDRPAKADWWAEIAECRSITSRSTTSTT